MPSIYSSARIPRVSKLLISGLFQKVRVLAQDGESVLVIVKPETVIRWHSILSRVGVSGKPGAVHRRHSRVLAQDWKIRT